MHTRPNRTGTRHPGANDKTIASQYRLALARRVPSAVTADIPGARHYPHETAPTPPGNVSSADHPVRH